MAEIFPMLIFTNPLSSTVESLVPDAFTYNTPSAFTEVLPPPANT